MITISRKRLRQLKGAGYALGETSPGRIAIFGPVDWIKAVRSESVPPDVASTLCRTSTELWSTESFAVEPKISIGKESSGWTACWTYLGRPTAIQFSPDVTFPEIADPIRKAYAKTVGAGTMEDDQ